MQLVCGVKHTIYIMRGEFYKMQRRFSQDMQQECIAFGKLEQEDGQKWLLEYYLQTVKTPEDGTLYGIKVEKSTLDGVLTESEETFAITDNRDEIMLMINAFARGTVPPCVLLEMVDDWEWKDVLAVS